MLKIAVVDDVVGVCSDLENSLSRVARSLSLQIEVEPFYSGETLCKELKRKNSFDIIFLDIELQKMSGVQVAEYIRQTLNDEIQQIVFISGNPQYSLKLHAFHPLDFLIKDISDEAVETILKRYLKLTGYWNEFFEFKSFHSVLRYKAKDIKYLTVQNRIVHLVLSDNSYVQYYGTLEKAYEEQLKKFDFLFVHKQYIVNPIYVKTYEYERIELIDGTEIPIGSTKRKEIRAMQARLSMKRR